MSLHMLSMVHNNPGEAPFDTHFHRPEVLRQYGCTGQVFRRNPHAALSLAAVQPGLFPDGTAEAQWLQNEQEVIEQEIRQAKNAGLQVFYHIDLFLLPKALVEQRSDSLCDASGRIDLDKPATLEIHRALFEELFQRFPEIDGLLIRVGETYLHDTPFHVGNGAIPYEGGPREEQRRFVRLLRFLREEICTRHDKTLIHRTWDCFPDRFHASRDYYLAVTDQVEPHDKLIFSLKHTMLDFWRYVRPNPSIGQGRHPQIVEVQCQREYEGKGAFPDYVLPGVLDGFPENSRPLGLRDHAHSPLFRGVFAWPRGGGWFGPYLQSEIWCDLNMFVLSRWTRDPEKSEEPLCLDFCEECLGLDAANAERFRQIALLSMEAVLKGRYCEVFDRGLNEISVPTNIWFRDDRLAGPRLLEALLKDLIEKDTIESALKEKREAVSLWEEIVRLADSLSAPEADTTEAIRVSTQYGLRLFQVVLHGWEAAARGLQGNLESAKMAVAQYDAAWKHYRALQAEPICATLFEGVYWAMPGEKPEPGLDALIARWR